MVFFCVTFLSYFEHFLQWRITQYLCSWWEFLQLLCFNAYLSIIILSGPQVSSKDEDFLDLSVDVEQNTSITSCLRGFSNTETLMAEHKYYCEVCCSKQEAQKRWVVLCVLFTPVLTTKLCHFKQKAQKRWVVEGAEMVSSAVCCSHQCWLPNCVTSSRRHRNGELCGVCCSHQCWLLNCVAPNRRHRNSKWHGVCCSRQDWLPNHVASSRRHRDGVCCSCHCRLPNCVASCRRHRNSELCGVCCSRQCWLPNCVASSVRHRNGINRIRHTLHKKTWIADNDREL